MLRSLLYSALALLARGQGQAGIAASVSTTGLNYVLAELIPVLEAELASITVPGTQGNQDGFDYDLSNVACGSFTIGPSSITTAASSGITASLSGVSVACSASWSFKLKSWPHEPSGSGSVDVSATGTSVTIGLNVTEVALHPQLAVTASAINIGSIDLTFHGSLWDWLINLFKGTVESAIKKGITDAFNTAIPSLVTGKLNAELAAIAMSAPLNIRAPYNISEVRFGLVADPAFTADFIGVALQGDVVPIANAVDPPIAPPALPPWNAANGAYFVQAQLSSYTLSSAVYTYLNAGLMNWLVESDRLPEGFNSTAAYAIIAPGLPAAYPGAAVSLDIALQSMPNITFASAGLNISAPITIAFLVAAPNGTAVDAFTILASTSLAGALSIGPDANGTLALLGDIAFLETSLSLVSSTVGAVSIDLLDALVNVLFSTILVPTINLIFANGIPLPSIDGISLVNTTLIWSSEGYVTLATNFEYNPAALMLA